MNLIEKPEKHVHIWTDGSCLGNPGPGGWAALLRYNTAEKELSGGVASATNNQMELQAAIEALNALRCSCTVELWTDSAYVRNGILSWIENWKKQGWKNSNKKAVKNQDLWQELDKARARHTVTWHWLRGHSGHAENERVDVLAVQAAYAVAGKSGDRNHFPAQSKEKKSNLPNHAVKKSQENSNTRQI